MRLYCTYISIKHKSMGQCIYIVATVGSRVFDTWNQVDSTILGPGHLESNNAQKSHELKRLPACRTAISCLG